MAGQVICSTNAQTVLFTLTTAKAHLTKINSSFNLRARNSPHPMQESVTHFTERCRHLQGHHRLEQGLEMDLGPFPSSTRKHENMIVRGEETGKNFLNDFTFQYAKARVANKQKKETIEEYRLFNNLLSSHPMAFNLFCPFIQMLQEGRTTEVTRNIQAVFPTSTSTKSPR